MRWETLLAYLLVQAQSFILLLYSRIFELALKKADIDGSKAVHIGNSYVSPQIFCELMKMNDHTYSLHHAGVGLCCSSECWNEITTVSQKWHHGMYISTSCLAMLFFAVYLQKIKANVGLFHTGARNQGSWSDSHTNRLTEAVRTSLSLRLYSKIWGT